MLSGNGACVGTRCHFANKIGSQNTAGAFLHCNAA